MAEIEEKKVEIPESTKWKSKAEEPDYVFRIFACGGKGGAYQSDLTSFFIAHKDQPYNFLSMDAGSGMDCIRKAKENGVLNAYLLDEEKFKAQPDVLGDTPNFFQLSDVGYFKQKQLNGFLVTHAHIDHTAGLVVGSADDAYAAKKPVIAQTDVVTAVKGTFKQPLWPGMFDPLQFYVGKELNPGDGFKEMSALGSESERFKESPIHVKSFRLSHDSSLGDSWSTAFLICTEPKSIKSTCVLFFGDVGPDNLEWINMKNNVIFHMADNDKKFDFPPGPSTERNDHDLTKAKDPKELRDAFQKLDSASAAENFKLFKELFIAKNGEAEESPFHKSDKPKKPDPFAGLAFQPLHEVWDAVEPLILKGRLKTIFIESSYTKMRPDHLLFGHLTPKKLQDELDYLEGKIPTAMVKEPGHGVIVAPSITVFAMHIKPKFMGKGAKKYTLQTPHLKMQSELLAVQTHFAGAGKKLKVKIEIPYQTDMMYVYGAGKATDIHRHGTYLAAKADVQGSQLQSFRSESEDEDEGDADGVYGQGVLGSAGYQAHAYENAYAHHGLYGGQGFGGGGYGPPPAYQVMSYAPGYVVDAPPTSVVGSGSQSADLFPAVFLALGTLICCVAVVFGMFVCGWVFHRVSRPRKVPRFARLSAQDQDDIEYGGNI
mmetsp:Transcript_16919/g.26298  ORF Transcript_16919/g.26298 Transcript_16919/m.26298 type:complete len:656 (+) Transcript_16919:94-2061(+)